MHDFAGQTAVVTGGTRGIGLAVSEAFLAAGANVVAVYAGNDGAARALRERHDSAHLETIRLDVADAEACERFWKELAEKRERVEILVNNAGIRRDAALALMPVADWRRVLDVNLTGAYQMAKGAVKWMASKRYGRIINVTSPSGRFGFEGQSNYAASKAGLVAMTKSLAREVAKRGVTANCVSPGFIDTEFIADLLPEQAESYRKSVPMKRFGTGAEVAYAVLFLASREAGYVTGATLEVTGGL